MRSDSALETQLRELQVDVEHIGDPRSLAARVRLSHGRSSEVFSLISGDSIRLTNLTPDVLVLHEPIFVYTNHVGAKTADGFRQAGVQYLDSAGNAWIHFGGVLIDVRGRPSRADPARPRAAGDLFSSGRSQTIFALLAWPELARRPQRELAECAGVSLGQVNRTLSLLESAGYRTSHEMANADELLDLWAAAFRTGLARKLELARLSGDVSAPLKQHRAELITVSGETAVPELLRPASATYYVSGLDPMLPVVNRWRVDGPPNIAIRRQFWRPPGGASAAPSGQIHHVGVQTAPWPLVYADLLGSDDPRVRKAAHEVRAGYGLR